MLDIDLLNQVEDFIDDFIKYNGLNDMYWVPKNDKYSPIDLQHECHKRTSFKIFLESRLLHILSEWLCDIDGFTIDFKNDGPEYRKYLIEQIPDFPYVMGFWEEER